VKSNLKFVVALLLLGGTTLFLQARSRNEIIPDREPLSSFPRQIGMWRGSDVPIPQDQLDVLGAGDFLLRVYRDTTLQEPYVDIFVAYFPSQRAGDTIHSPKNCLPGAGWSPMEADRISLSLPGQAAFMANRYVIAKGQDRQLVLYWYWAHGRAVASEYWAKVYLVSDSMRLNRSDGSMIRVTTPLLPSDTIEKAQQRLVAFAAEVVPHLNPYVPQ
jgi:EpsI family protein